MGRSQGRFPLESTLGHLYQSPQQGATVPFYGCKGGSMDYFVSLDSLRRLSHPGQKWLRLLSGRLRGLTWSLCTAAALATIIS